MLTSSRSSRHTVRHLLRRAWTAALLACMASSGLAVALSRSPTSPTPLPPPVSVFRYNTGVYPCTRIPSIIAVPAPSASSPSSSASAGQDAQPTLLAAAECRLFIHDGCDPQHAGPAFESAPFQFGVQRYLCLRNSTDLGATWGVLQENVTHSAVMNPSLLYVGNQTVLLQYNDAAGYSQGLAQIYQIRSEDGGRTWSSPLNISAQVGQNVLDLGTAGAGTVVPSGKYAGRIVFAGYQQNAQSSYLQSRVWYSDDGGRTYKLGATVLAHFSEPQLTALSDGTVVILGRNNEHYQCRCRHIATSTDGGETFTNIQAIESLPDPACEGPITVVDDRMYVLSPGSAYGRVNATLFGSIQSIQQLLRDDQAPTFKPLYHLSTPAWGSAYSALTAFRTSGSSSWSLGMLWETNATGCVGPSCQIMYTPFQL